MPVNTRPAVNSETVWGGRGSPVVLQRLISAWYRDHGPALAGSSSALTAPAAGLRSQFDALMRDALARLDREQADRDRTLAAKSAELDERERLLGAREAAIAPLLDDMRAQHREALTAREAALLESAQSHARLEVVQNRLQVLEAELHRAHAFEAEATYAREALTRQQERVKELVGKRDELERTVKDLGSEAADLRRKLDELRERFTVASVELARTRERLERNDAP